MQEGIDCGALYAVSVLDDEVVSESGGRRTVLPTAVRLAARGQLVPAGAQVAPLRPSAAAAWVCSATGPAGEQLRRPR